MRTLSDDERDLLVVLYVPLRRLAGVVRPAEVDADDLLHDALARLLAHTDLTELGDPLAYARRAVVNHASNLRRRLGRWRRVRDRLVASTEAAGTDRYPSDVAELLRLPPTARAVVYLTAVEGYTFAEVADLLGCSEVAARKTASRARRRLAVELLEQAAR